MIVKGIKLIGLTVATDELSSKSDMAKKAYENFEVELGQAAYTPRVLRVYDFLVLRLFNRLVWRCPREKLSALYRERMTDNHLDCGVGTGFFVDECATQRDSRFALIDLNPHSLEVAFQKLRRFKPMIFRKNILEKLDLDCDPFDSIGMNYLLHCIPGKGIDTKSVAFDNVLPYLTDDGTLFGATILGQDLKKPILAKLLMSHFNRRGIFSNQHDTLGDLMEELSRRFRTFNVEVSGCVVLFWGKGVRGRAKKTED